MKGTTFGMPHQQMGSLRRNLQNVIRGYGAVRFQPAERKHQACLRIARAATGPRKDLKFEGAYHACRHRRARQPVKPNVEDYGDPEPQFRSRWRRHPRLRSRRCRRPLHNLEVRQTVLKKKKSSISRTDRRDHSRTHPHERRLVHAAAPVFWAGPLRDICTKKNCALLISTKVKTGAQLAWGGARLFRRETGHDLPGHVHRRRLAAGSVRARERAVLTDLRAAQGFPRRHIQ